MHAHASALSAWSSALAGLTYSGFALFLAARLHARADGRRMAAVFLSAVVCTALWAWSGLGASLSGSSLALGAGPLLDVLRYACWFFFLLAILRSAQAGAKAAAYPAVLVGMSGALVVAALLVQGPLGELLFGFSTRAQAFAMMAASVFGLFLVEQFFRNVPADLRWNAKPLCLGLGGIFLFDFYLYSVASMFSNAPSDAATVRAGVHALMAPLLILSTTRRADWVSKLRVSRQLAFRSATLLAAGIYLLFIAGVGYYIRFFGGEWGQALQVALSFCALVAGLVIGLSGTMRAKIKVLLGKHFFRYRYDYREEWLKFTQTLSSQASPQAMGMQVIRGLGGMVESPAGLLWLKNAAGGDFIPTAAWNMAPPQASEPEQSSLLSFMSETGWLIDLDEYRSAPQRYVGLILPAWLVLLPQAWLIVPLRAGDSLIGFVLLAQARTRVDVNWEVTDLLKTAGRQAASFLAQMQATEALLEARKFEAFNRMSAFVVHDLKNIVTQLSLMLKNAQRLQHNPEFQQDMLLTVQNSLDRMRQLMLQLREGNAPAGAGAGVDLSAIAKRVQSLALHRGCELELQLRERPVTRGHEEKLERILGHLVHNAIDASPPGGRVWMTIDKFGGSARIEVGDAGHGMSAEFVRDDLFKPFRSSKPGGMGIGAYESFQYVNELGGKMSVESAPQKGTVVNVLLPLLDTRVGSDLRMLEPS